VPLLRLRLPRRCRAFANLTFELVSRRAARRDHEPGQASLCLSLADVAGGLLVDQQGKARNLTALSGRVPHKPQEA